MESSLSVSSMQDPSSSPLEKQQSSASGNGGLDSEEGSSLEEIGFNWGEYLEETGASAAPHTSFKHVEISLQSNFQPGMKLEVANKNNPDTYWVATVITTCGQLLLLRYCGYGEDRRADFWCDVVIADLHPVGWCTQNNKALMPPDGSCRSAKPFLHSWDEARNSEFERALSYLSCISDQGELPSLALYLHVQPTGRNVLAQGVERSGAKRPQSEHLLLGPRSTKGLLWSLAHRARPSTCLLLGQIWFLRAVGAGGLKGPGGRLRCAADCRAVNSAASTWRAFFGQPG
uniref:Scm like with four mbt domains 2 n=1 Tax=Canis lupus familiaris TaxID=9615 RepID=A0A8C0PQ64_CANLF